MASEPIEMSMEELLALPATVPLVRAARIWGIGRTKAHKLARDGDFPCHVEKIGGAYRAARVDIFEALGMTDPLMAQAS